MFFSVAVSFAETSIKAEVDKTSMTTDEALTYKLTINSSERNTPLPQIPKFEGFAVVSQAQSSNIAFVKGGIKTVIVYTFILVAKDIGKFKIEPGTIKINNKTYPSEAFEIEVTQGKAMPKPEEEPSYPEEFPSETEAPQTIL